LQVGEVDGDFSDASLAESWLDYRKQNSRRFVVYVVGWISNWPLR